MANSAQCGQTIKPQQTYAASVDSDRWGQWCWVIKDISFKYLLKNGGVLTNQKGITMFYEQFTQPKFILELVS